MRKRFLIIAMVVGLVMLFAAGGIYAGKDVKDEIPMQNNAYEKHTKSIHAFTHKKHATEFAQKNPDIFPNGCGACHHDKENKPLKNLKMGDDVQNCIECHKKPGYVSGKDAKEKGLDEKQEREYHANALHENCQGCHKKYNDKKGLKSKDKGFAPTKSKCKACHTKDND
ncbi:MAG: cytochrome c3 family protein [Pseudomonadota bacterium]|uniref:Cytochrome c3 family protein n=1 Tax=Candidatus Desulfatibia profunda TaxID=2841695 RepID=A0A8J6NPV5_9BACT|nr:cytochrome c3 family protein [Candidatus Desulfatibia profunda]